jgi:hypothetical protein
VFVFWRYLAAIVIGFCGFPARAHPRGGGVTGLQPSLNPPKPKFKKTYFVGVMISNVLRDVPFSRNQPLKSAGDWYIVILKNKLIE